MTTTSCRYISTSTNRNPFPGWVFFTFPRSGSVSKGEIAAEFSALGSTQFIIALEHHADGEPHIHACAKLPPRKYTKSKVLKHFQEKYPDASKRIDVGRIVRNSTPHHAWTYCLKESTGSNQPIVVGEPPHDAEVDRLNAFARNLGFRDLAHLRRDVARSDAIRESQERKLLEILAWLDDHPMVEELCPIRCRHVLEYFQKNHLSLDFSWLTHDDITFATEFDYSSLLYPATRRESSGHYLSQAT